WFHGQFCDNQYCNGTNFGEFYYDENAPSPGPLSINCEGPYTIGGQTNVYTFNYRGGNCPNSINDLHCYQFSNDDQCLSEVSPNGLDSSQVCFTTGSATYQGGPKKVWVR